MKSDKRKRLEAAGWKVGSTRQFLGLSNEESAYIEMKLALARGLRKQRESQNLTQTDLARRIGSSQSRVAKMESADPTVSLDLLVQSLLSLGTSPQDVARLLRPVSRAA
ncbi:MAG: helix-turn-helix transcriptional regulator [Phycisphaeraceae bacterium]